MPTTPAGTAYTVHSATVSGAGLVYWAIADAAASDADRPFVIYCHGAAGAANQFATASAWAGLRNWLIDNGWGWVEGDGGGSQPWGNPASQTAYAASFAHVDGLFDISHVVVLGRSMGGAVGARIYNAMRATDPRVVGFICNSGVQDLVWAYDWDSGRWTAAFNAAWGVSNKTQFQAAVAGLNPVDGPSSAWNGANVLQLWGSADTTVTPAANALAMRTMYAGHPAIDDGYERPGGDHSAGNGSYLDVPQMVAFLETVTGGEPEPIPVPTYIEATAMYVVGADGLMYEVLV